MNAEGEIVPRESANQALADAALTACPSCDLLQRLPSVAPGQSACCPRCGTVLWRRRVESLNRTLALTVAAAILCLIANTVPMLGLTVVGRESFTTVAGGAKKLWENGQHTVALLVFFAAVLAPALQIGLLLLVLLAARRKRPPAWVGLLLRHLPFSRTWSMIEVMLLGVLVALTKIADYATVIPGQALFALFALVFVLAAMQSTFDPKEIWDRVEWAETETRKPATGGRTMEATA